jgi:UDP-glucose 4-epimerase
MILVTGGLGFVGLHTARALLDLGHSCVLTRHHTDRRPGFLAAELGKRAFIESCDLNDRDAVLDLGRRHTITGIVHLAEGGIGIPSLAEEVQLSAAPLMNVLHAARAWGVGRVTVASAIGVYLDAGESPLREDIPLPLTATHPIELMKKTSELLCSFIAARADFEIVSLRLCALYGPLYQNMSSLAVPAKLVHAALNGTKAEFEPPYRPHAEDGADWSYVTDCARAIALLQVAEHLEHRVYNVGSGYPTKNVDFVSAIGKALPGADIALPEGGPGQDVYFDITRLREATGFEPEYDVESGIAEYVDWLRSGNAY